MFEVGNIKNEIVESEETILNCEDEAPWAKDEF